MAKDGWRSTEFWATLLTNVGGLLALFGVHVPIASPAVSGVVSAVGGAIAAVSTVYYTVQRSRVKRAEAITAAPVEIVRVE